MGIAATSCRIAVPPTVTRLTVSRADRPTIHNHPAAEQLEMFSLADVAVVDDFDRILALPRLKLLFLEGRSTGLQDQVGTFVARGGHLKVY